MASCARARRAGWPKGAANSLHDRIRCRQSGRPRDRSCHYARLSVYYRRGTKGAACRTFGVGIEKNEAHAIGQALIAWADGAPACDLPCAGDPDAPAPSTSDDEPDDFGVVADDDSALSPSQLSAAIDESAAKMRNAARPAPEPAQASPTPSPLGDELLCVRIRCANTREAIQCAGRLRVLWYDVRVETVGDCDMLVRCSSASQAARLAVSLGPSCVAEVIRG